MQQSTDRRRSRLERSGTKRKKIEVKAEGGVQNAEGLPHWEKKTSPKERACWGAYPNALEGGGAEGKGLGSRNGKGYQSGETPEADWREPGTFYQEQKTGQNASKN